MMASAVNTAFFKEMAGPPPATRLLGLRARRNVYETVPEQKHEARPPHDFKHNRSLLHNKTNTRHTGKLEHRISHRADQYDLQHVFTFDALTQHKRVLGTNRDDQTESGEQTGYPSSEHSSDNIARTVHNTMKLQLPGLHAVKQSLRYSYE